MIIAPNTDNRHIFCTLTFNDSSLIEIIYYAPDHCDGWTVEDFVSNGLENLRKWKEMPSLDPDFVEKPVIRISYHYCDSFGGSNKKNKFFSFGA